MRVLMLLLIALAIGACTTGVREVGESQLKERVGVQFEVTDGQVSQVPFTGRLRVFYDDGTPRRETHYKDGKREGLDRDWYENGQLESEYTYKNGKREGLDRVWYENGQLESETTWKNGSQEGLSRAWYENGQLKYEEAIRNGSPEGLSRAWYENGQLESEDTWKDGKQDGLQREWHENGQLKFEETWKNGRREGLSRWWHENGQLKFAETVKNRSREGLSREWHDNGQLMWAVTYKDGEREGLQREWYENGQLMAAVTFKDGKAAGVYRLWHENSQLKQEVTFKDGGREGLSRWWHENGQLKHEWCYANDKWVDMDHCQPCSSVPDRHADRPVDQDTYYLADRPVDDDKYYDYYLILLEHILPLKDYSQSIAFRRYETYVRARKPAASSASLRIRHRDGKRIIVASVRQIKDGNLSAELSNALDLVGSELDLASQINWTERELSSSECPELTEIWEGARKLKFPSPEDLADLDALAQGDGELVEEFVNFHARTYEMALNTDLFNTDFRRISIKGQNPFFADWIDDSFSIIEACDSQ